MTCFRIFFEGIRTGRVFERDTTSRRILMLWSEDTPALPDVVVMPSSLLTQETFRFSLSWMNDEVKWYREHLVKVRIYSQVMLKGCRTTDWILVTSDNLQFLCLDISNYNTLLELHVEDALHHLLRYLLGWWCSGFKKAFFKTAVLLWLIGKLTSIDNFAYLSLMIQMRKRSINLGHPRSSLFVIIAALTVSYTRSYHT
jgi:hypothetical protein